MKVGIIGLGRMGEGMSRRMIKAGIEVHGYRNNVQKANEQFEKGYISGYATSLESCSSSTLSEIYLRRGQAKLSLPRHLVSL